MRNIVLTIIAITATLTAQSINRVQFRTLPGNLIEITYSLADSEPKGIYSIELMASLDGGYSFPIAPSSVTGDVGIVRGSGRKAILWKVLDDLPALTAEALVFKVVGQNHNTVGAFFRSLVIGNRLTKRLSNGVTLYAGQNLTTRFEDRTFTELVSDGMLLAGPQGRVGLRVTNVPFIYKFEGMAQVWELGYPDSTLQQLRLLSYGNESYGGETLRLYQLGAAASVSYTPLPVFGLFLPYVGAGAAIWRHSIGQEWNSELSAVNSTSLFVEVGLQANLRRWLKLTLGERQYYRTPRYDYAETFLELGVHFF